MAMARKLLLLAAALCALASAGHADEAQRAKADAGMQERSSALSIEDAELIKQLALLEDVELLRNLDLFEPKSADSTQAADGGTTTPPQPDPGR
jgi:hypothetical protein